MRFNNTIIVQEVEYDDFGDTSSVTERELKCIILSHEEEHKNWNNNTRNRADLIILTSRKSYEPYKGLMSNPNIRFKYEDKIYTAVMVAGIHDFSGKIKYHRVEMMEEVKADA